MNVRLPSTAAIRRGAAFLAPAVPLGIGLYLGWEIFLSAREVLADAAIDGTLGGFGDILSEKRSAAVNFCKEHGANSVDEIVEAITSPASPSKPQLKPLLRLQYPAPPRPVDHVEER